MDRRTLLKSTTALPLTASGLAVAATPKGKPQPAQASNQAVQILAVQLPAWINANGQRKPVRPGSEILSTHEVETGSGGGMVLQLPDHSTIRLSESSRLGIERLQADIANGQVNVQSQLKLYGGMFRYATSAISKVFGTRRIDLALRTATVGIRGTDFWCMTDEAHDAACLFEGRVDLSTRDQGELTLDKPTAFWARFFDKPVQPVGAATPQQLSTFLSSTELKPGTGVLIPDGQWSLTLNTESVAQAISLAQELNQLGFPATASKGKAVVSIAQLATRQDADGLLRKLSALPSLAGRIRG